MGTGVRIDPFLNFNSLVEIDGITRAAFHEVSGLDSTVDVIEHREGGDNTITRKLPGQSDVGPLSLIRGLFMLPRSPQVEWFKHVFAVQWGKGNTGYNEDFRCNAIIRVMKHPVTKWSAGGEGDPNSGKSAGAAFIVYNCWPGSVNYNDLNAGDNSIMVETMRRCAVSWRLASRSMKAPCPGIRWISGPRSWRLI